MKNTEKMMAMFGRYTDSEIAKAIGKSRQYVSNYRDRIGIKGFKKWDRYIGLLGSRPDKEIASLVGVSCGAVVRKRLREGIRPFGESKERTLQEKFVKTLPECKEYVRTPYGIIDVLTDEAIYELKSPLDISAYQRAIGQLMTYSNKYRGRKIVIVTDEVKINKHLVKTAAAIGIDIITFVN